MLTAPTDLLVDGELARDVQRLTVLVEDLEALQRHLLGRQVDPAC